MSLKISFPIILLQGSTPEFWIKNDPLVLSGDMIAIPYEDTDTHESKTYLNQRTSENQPFANCHEGVYARTEK